MKTTQTPNQYRFAIRTAFLALDSIQRLQDHGYGGGECDKAQEHIRRVINRVEAIPVREKGKKP
jgi:hypothetical protein